MTRSKGRLDVEERKLRIMRAATTVASTHHDCTGKPRAQRAVAPVSLPRLKCLEPHDDQDDDANR